MLNDLLAKNQSSDKLFVEDVFSTWLYTGNGGTQTITNGIDLAGKGGVVWIKDRTNAGATDPNHYLTSSDTSFTKTLTPNATSAAINYSAVQSVSSTGYVDKAGWPNGNPMVSWTFREAPNFFDVVTYTGNGGTQTINHNLGVAPGMIIVKATSTTGSWWVYHRSLGNNFGLRLELTNAATNAGGNEWSATATTFTAPSGFNQNASGVSYVAYLFAHDTTADGVIQCGSLSASSATTVTLGWEPQYVLLKQSSGAQSWYVVDVMRGLSYRNFVFLQTNTSDAEADAGVVIEPTATGFTFKGGNLGATSGQTYIYMAIRRGPMRKPTDGTKVFAPVTYTGNGATGNTARTLTVGFPADLGTLWMRSGSQDYWLDKLRGTTASLATTSTGAESAATGYFYNDFSNTTATIQDVTGTNFNASGTNYISYFLRRAPSFFDVVCYQATNVSNRQINHNLGVAPELMIVKDRTASGTWAVYTPLGAMGLNADAGTSGYNGAAFFGNGTSVVPPTSTVFTVGQSMNWSTDNFVAYLFGSCPGVSKVGSYTGTGTTLQINCGFTNGARFVLIKRTDSTGDWYVYDTARGIVAGNDPYLFLNSTAAEVTNTDYVDAYSAGFELSSTAPAALNANGGTYIYLAIA